jgi:hypothetical protein
MQTENNKLAAAIADANPVASSCEQYLLARYGATMSLANVAAELGTTTNALRIRQLRCGDLPPRIPGVRGYRWPTMTIACWINRLAGPLGEPVAIEPLLPAKPNRPGRPRKHSSHDDVQGGGV